MHLYFSTLLHFAAAYLMSQPIWTTSSLNPNFSLQNLAIELYCILHFSPGKLYYFQTLPPKFGPFCTLLVFLFLFLFLVFLLNSSRSWQLPSLLDHQVSIVFITGMVPHRLPVGKVEIVNITCDVLARDEQRLKVSLCSGTKLLRKKRKGRKMAKRQRRKKN